MFIDGLRVVRTPSTVPFESAQVGRDAHDAVLAPDSGLERSFVDVRQPITRVVVIKQYARIVAFDFIFDSGQSSLPL